MFADRGTSWRRLLPAVPPRLTPAVLRPPTAVLGHAAAECYFSAPGARSRAIGRAPLALVRANLDLHIANYVLCGGVKLNPRVSLGVGVSYYEFRLDSTTARFDTSEFAGPSDFLPEQVVNRQFLHGADHDVALN